MNNGESTNVNAVAKIAKVYAILNAIAWVFIAIELYDNLRLGQGWIAFFSFAAGLVASFFIYCIGEGLQLLQDIKDGTRKPKEARFDPEELPDL